MRCQAVLRSFLVRLLVLVAIIAAMSGAFAVTGSTAHAQEQPGPISTCGSCVCDPGQCCSVGNFGSCQCFKCPGR